MTRSEARDCMRDFFGGYLSSWQFAQVNNSQGGRVEVLVIATEDLRDALTDYFEVNCTPIADD